jgi:hypothetical protein
MRYLAALLLLCASTLSFAHNCPNEMKAIDAALPGTKLAGADLARVKALRADGEKAHAEGKHGDSMKALGEAKKLLGI